MGGAQQEGARNDSTLIRVIYCIQHLHEEDNRESNGSPSKDERKTICFEQDFPNEEVFNMKIAKDRSVTEHLNQFNMVTSQL